jgi:diguanylate cyclase (GGDEF)-like protein
MSDSESGEIQGVEVERRLDDALVEVEQRLDETFEAAERRTQNEADSGAGLVLEQVLDLIYETFDSFLPYHRIGLTIVDEDGAVLRSSWARAEGEGRTRRTAQTAPLDEDSVRILLESGEPWIVNDLDAYLEGQAGSGPARLITGEGMRASLFCPLRSADKTVGMLVFANRERDVYTDDHRELFGQVSQRFAGIVERSCLHERLIDLNWQLRVAHDALAYQASHDGLTRLWNRGAILAGAERELDRARRQGNPITIVMADIDGFRSINEGHGNAVGDEVLQFVADRLASALRSYETVGRYGDEEFLVTLYDCGAEDAPRAMERMRRAVGGTEATTASAELPVTISLGAASCTGAGAELDDLIRTAGEALDEARKSGGNAHVVKLMGDQVE